MIDRHFCTGHTVCANHSCLWKPDGAELRDVATGVLVAEWVDYHQPKNAIRCQFYEPIKPLPRRSDGR